MANFNPDIPNKNDPSYLHYSHPIGDVEGDKSMGVALSGAANLLKLGVEGADTTIKSSITNDLYSQIDQQREKYTQGLEVNAGVPGQERVGNPLNVLPEDKEAPIPQAVQQAAKSAENVQNASVLGADAPSIYYEGRLDMIAKDVRSKWPGYREFIDQKVSQITGGTPANEYIKKIEHALKTSASGHGDTMKSDLATIMHHADNIGENPEAGIPGAAEMYKKRQAGLIGGAEVAKWISDGYATKRILTTKTQEANMDTLDRDGQKRTATEGLRRFGADLINNDTVTLMNGDKTNLAELNKKLTDMQTGKTPMNDQFAREAVQVMNAREAALTASFYKGAYQRDKDNPNVKSLGEIIGDDNVVKQMFSDLMTPHKENKQLLADDKVGLAMHNAKLNIAMLDDQFAFLTRNPSVPEAQRMYNVNMGLHQKFGGPTYVELYSEMLKDPAITSDTIKAAAVDGFNRVILPGAQGRLTATQFIQNQKAGGVGIPPDGTNHTIRSAGETHIYDHTMALPDLLTRADVPDAKKSQLVKGFYGYGNEGLLKEFGPDRRDAKGNFIPGAETMFLRLTSEDKTKAIFDLAKKGDNQAWYDYKGAAEHWHRELFGQKIIDLNEISKDARVKLSFNDKSNSINIDSITTGDAKIDAGAFQVIKDRYVNNIAYVNRAFSSMANIAKAEGQNPTAYIMKESRGLGLDTQSGVGADLLRAFLTATTPPKKKTP